ncbi:hypothetical protein C923_00126 [Plasmodium falciparum UGT5.1]|uniref:Uncharacterized protein n=1 Tax=Plasmodium falciparum UGT5.1 TaxID=1237627 RepID=W7JVQ1_PLAFA|nr:hypothetical protein C923_00126 [Plasmodium falciparum UGT5.1]
MGGKNIICKDIKSNLLLNPSEINDNQKAQEIKKKVVKDLMKNENKEIFKQIETINSVGTMAKIKNSLYNMIFRGVNFWKGLAIYLGALSGGAIGQMILSFIFQFTTLYTFSYAATFTALPTLIAFGSFLGIILLTIITVFCLLVWLWPSKKKLMVCISLMSHFLLFSVSARLVIYFVMADLLKLSCRPFFTIF